MTRVVTACATALQAQKSPRVRLACAMSSCRSSTRVLTLQSGVGIRRQGSCCSRTVHRRGCPVRASKDQKDDKRGVDWDSAWTDFKSTAKRGIPETEAPKKAPTFSRGRRPTSLQESIRKQENLVLDAWSSENAFKVGGVVVISFLAFVVAIALQSSG